MKETEIRIENGGILARVLNQVQNNIYITDFETDEILFMNDAMKQDFHLEHPEGKLCFKILQEGMEERCGFCRCGELREGKKLSIWHEENTRNGNIYKNYDSLFEWEGRTYHIQVSADITEFMEIKENASVDELTGLPNRRAGKEMLGEIIQKARQENVNLTAALFDVNELKQVNDKYGHGEGDHLLRYVTEITRGGLKQDEFLFRLSGDEFFVVFYQEGYQNADIRMRGILDRMRAERDRHAIFYEASFSYGLFEIYPGDRYTITDIIGRADEKMYVQKRNYHIRRAEERLNEAISVGEKHNFEYDKEKLYDALAVSTDDYLFAGNMKTGTFRYPPAMVMEFGLPDEVVENAAAVLGKLVHPHDAKGFLESNQEIADGREEYHNIEYRAKNVKGEWIWLRCRGRMMRDEQGMPDLFAGFITNLGRKNQTDHTTGLYNRFEFEGNIKKYLTEEKAVSSMGIMVLDMDAFKNINDLYGRSFGDEVLKVSAQKIASLLPSNARIYRMDGDEFGIIILNGKKDEYLDIFGRIQYKFHRQQEYGGKKYYCTLSAGYAAYPMHADNYLDLLRCANFSLEYSKAAGKNRVTVFSEEIQRKKERRLELAGLLRESIERGFSGFSICFQAQVDLRTKVLHGAEALARWQCEKYGNVSPSEFIPILEQSGLIVQLGSWVLYHAAVQCREWCRIKPDFQMSVNLSYLQLLEGDIVSGIRQTLKETHIKPENLVLELTDTYLVKEDGAIHDVIEEIRRSGIRIAMDDFGIGYFSLYSLKSIPVDIVKIDKCFVKGITTDPFNATFIRSITQLCHDVGKKVCLEGVENHEEFDAVKDVGMELAQGYYFGYPIRADMFQKKWM